MQRKILFGRAASMQLGQVHLLDFRENKGEYPRTRASDFKLLPEVILNVFLCEYTRVMFNVIISIQKKVSTLKTLKKNFEMVGMFWLGIYHQMFC